MKKNILLFVALILAAICVVKYYYKERASGPIASIEFIDATYNIDELVHCNVSIEELNSKMPSTNDSELLLRAFTVKKLSEYLELCDKPENADMTDVAFSNWRKNIENSRIVLVTKYVLSRKDEKYIYYIYKNEYIEGYLMRGQLLKIVDGKAFLAGKDDWKRLRSISRLLRLLSTDGLLSLLGDSEAYSKKIANVEDAVKSEFHTLQGKVVHDRTVINGDELVQYLTHIPPASDTSKHGLLKTLNWEPGPLIAVTPLYKGAITEEILAKHIKFVDYLKSVHCTSQQIDDMIRDIVSERYVQASDKLEKVLKTPFPLESSFIINKYYPNAIGIVDFGKKKK